MCDIDPDKILDGSRKRLLDVMGMPDVKQNCETYDIDTSKMTNARLFARFMSRFRLYNPQAGGNSNNSSNSSNEYTENGKQLPSLDAAWAYYEHVTLPRHYAKDGGKRNEKFVRADMGEKGRPTELYPVWKTPVRELKAFGISVRLYFTTVLTLSVFLFISGILNLPLFWYFWNYDEDHNKQGIDRSVRGTAVCDDSMWVECEDCNGQYAYLYPSSRLDGQNVRVNTCNFDDWLVPGLFSYAASITLIIMFGIAYFSLQRRAEIVFDEEIQTASDYSIKVTNPPNDALDPEEWRRFFKPFAEKNITMVTIAIDNAKLIETLVLRRKALQQLKKKLKRDIDMTDRGAVESAVKESITHSMFRIPFIPTPESIFEQVKVYEETVKSCVHKKFKAVAVFVTFETESAQRNCLHALSTGKLNIWWNRTDASRFNGKELTVLEAAQSSSLDATGLVMAMKGGEEMKERSIKLVSSFDSVDIDRILTFRGKKVLSVKEAGEPNDVRWKDLQVPGKRRAIQFVQTNIIMFVFIAWSGFFIAGFERKYSSYTPWYITVTNILVPKICEFVNNKESHSREADKNASLYIKVAVFRWFNSAICLSIVLSFIETISVEGSYQDEEKSLTMTVYAIIFAEMFTSPIVKYIDVMGNLKKHILAPRAADQEEMNSYFEGGKFELAERYSDAAKVLFVALFYSTIMPETLFLGALALLAHFWSGKYCLLRLWRSTPDIGAQLSRLSRNYFFSFSLIVHVTMSAYFWSGFPYDSVCQVDGGYQYCNQDFLRSLVFPPLPRFQPEGMEWMSESQATLTSLYAYTSVALIIIGIFMFVKEVLYPTIKSYFYGTYEPDGEDQGISFSSVKTRSEVHGYIPQVQEQGFEYPLLACNLSGIDLDLVGWKDPIHGFDKHNLYNDVKKILGGKDPSNLVFSPVKYWSVDSEDKDE